MFYSKVDTLSQLNLVDQQLAQDRTHEYLAHAFQLTADEIEIRDFYEEWLPDTIFDVHLHANRVEDVRELPAMIRGRPLSTFPGYTLEDFQRLVGIFHPSKKIVHLRFALPYKGIDWRSANQYLQEHVSPSN